MSTPVHGKNGENGGKEKQILFAYNFKLLRLPTISILIQSSGSLDTSAGKNKGWRHTPLWRATARFIHLLILQFFQGQSCFRIHNEEIINIILQKCIKQHYTPATMTSVKQAAGFLSSVYSFFHTKCKKVRRLPFRFLQMVREANKYQSVKVLPIPIFFYF